MVESIPASTPLKDGVSDGYGGVDVAVGVGWGRDVHAQVVMYVMVGVGGGRDG